MENVIVLSTRVDPSRYARLLELAKREGLTTSRGRVNMSAALRVAISLGLDTAEREVSRSSDDERGG